MMIDVPKLVDFLNRVGTVTDYEFEDVDLVPDSLCGTFSEGRLEELANYCAIHDEFHIISIRADCLYFNRPIEGAISFFLGRGDNNPELVCFEQY